MPQWRTQEILLARLRELGGGDVRFGAGPHGSHRRTRTGSPHGSPPARCAPRTRSRRTAGAPRSGGRSGIRMDGRDRGPRTRSWWRTYGSRGGPGPGQLAHLPGRGRHAQRSARCPAPRTSSWSPSSRRDGARHHTEGVRDVVAARTHLGEDDVTEVRWASDFRPRAALADRFRDGRVFLAGRCRAHPLPGRRPGAEHERAGRLQPGLEAGRGAARRRTRRPAGHVRGRNAAPSPREMLGLSTRIHRGEQERGAAARQLGLGYREGPLASGRAGLRRSCGPATGRRTAPRARRGGSSTSSVGRTSRCSRPARTPAPRARRRPAAGPPHEAGGPYGKGLFLVRPDGYIGWAGEDTTGLAEYARPLGLDLDFA